MTEEIKARLERMDNIRWMLDQGMGFSAEEVADIKAALILLEKELREG